MLIKDEHYLSRSRTYRPSGCAARARRTPGGSALPAAGAMRNVEMPKTCSENQTGNACTSFSFCCASLTWWSLRGGCTRSLSEHGRETPLRQWYFVLRRGRVGRCQVCKTQQIFSTHKGQTAKTRAAICGLLLLWIQKKGYIANQMVGASLTGDKLLTQFDPEERINHRFMLTAINCKAVYAWRGVEQPGSSSGS